MNTAVIERPEELYFRWLADKVRPVGEREGFKTYWRLFHYLHLIEFTWCDWIPGDENRAADGQYMRYRYFDETGNPWPDRDEPCSVFEMLVALARRINDDLVELDPRSWSPWFWEMMKNLRLDLFDDRHWNERQVFRVLDRFLRRTYKRNGAGGLFPVQDPRDQRRIEIWYQMNQYLNEMAEKEGTEDGTHWSIA
jgi:hypothetical protein